MKHVLSLLLVVALVATQVACTVDQVLSDLNLLLQTAAQITTVIGAFSATDAQAINTAVNIATTGLNVIQTDYDAYEKSGAQTDLEKLRAAIDTLKSNLPAEIAAAHITNPVSVAKVTAWVNLVVTTLDTILSVLPKSATGKKTALNVAALPSPDTLQARWQTDVCNGDAACGKLVKAVNVRR